MSDEFKRGMTEAAKICLEPIKYKHPLPCPDGIVGCMVFHYEERTRPKTVEECVREIVRLRDSNEMRLMLAYYGTPRLLVSTSSNYDPAHFSFYVVNGGWDGEFNEGVVTVSGYNKEDEEDLSGFTIVCDNQDRLRGEYNEVFANFHNLEYIAPPDPEPIKLSSNWDDDIPF